MTGKAVVVAVDGPTAAGKGTLARALAARFGLRYLDTGSLYRAVAARILAEGGDPGDPLTAAAAARSLTDADRARPELRSEVVGNAASQVAALPAVRAALLDYQRGFGAEPPGAVLDGRDVGTVVFPDAAAKLFVTATVEVRAARRHAELQARGEPADLEAVLADLEARDDRDRNRSASPLRAAVDARLLDTTDLSIEAALAAAMEHVAASTGLAPDCAAGPEDPE